MNPKDFFAEKANTYDTEKSRAQSLSTIAKSTNDYSVFLLTAKK